MLIEQMHELAPHISLAPDHVDLSSDEEEGNNIYHMNASNGGRHNGRLPLSSSSSSYYQQHHHHLDDRRRGSAADQYHRMNSDNNVPSSSINYFSGQLFGLSSGLDFGSDMEAASNTHHSGSSHGGSSKRNSNAGQHGFSSSAGLHGMAVGSASRQIMLSPEQAREEEARIEEEQKARQRSKSYNPDNVKVRIVSHIIYRSSGFERLAPLEVKVQMLMYYVHVPPASTVL